LTPKIKPKEHSGYPGFEKNLNALLYNALKDKNPHSEWPYASYIDKSSEKADIHIIHDNSEVWFELGMYASDEKAKYYKDFHKLSSIINKSSNITGVLIHFEIYERNVVIKIFKELKSLYSDCYKIEIKEFKNDNRTIACRLYIQSRCIEQNINEKQS
jgi:hypothetical protein